MAMDNKTLGRFELVGIPPAPRGIPQIEVTFDIDANGIVHVSAKDLATQKEQSIQITASSGLSEEEIKRFIKEGELHAEEDKKKREFIETKNHADALIYNTERTMRDMGDKVDAGMRQDIEAQIAKLKEAMEGTDRDSIQREMDQLTSVSHKLAEEAYKRAAEQQAAGAGAAESRQDASGAGKKPDDDVVDADFQEVKDK
jgi:molecular chaperone DnaK